MATIVDAGVRLDEHARARAFQSFASPSSRLARW